MVGVACVELELHMQGQSCAATTGVACKESEMGGPLTVAPSHDNNNTTAVAETSDNAWCTQN
jgi:hypothetical protein